MVEGGGDGGRDGGASSSGEGWRWQRCRAVVTIVTWR